MQNPSYLIRSRHAIYYFRYPMPEYGNGRLSISLNTRCPKEALRLSKVLEYHAFMVMSNTDTTALDYIEVKEILRNHFAEVLKGVKAKIDKEGALSEEQVHGLEERQAYALEAIRGKRDELYGAYFSEDMGVPEALSIDSELEPIAEKNGIIDKSSKEYKAMRKEYKHALNGYITSLLAYNNSNDFYDYTPATKALVKNDNKRSELKLANIITQYNNEKEGAIGKRGFNDQQSSLSFLVEVLGKEFLITEIEDKHVRKVRNMLMDVPKNRNKMPQTIGLSLEKQIEAREKHGLDRMSDTNINKYLSHMRALFNWARQSKTYSGENPFKDVKVTKEKKGKRRNYIDKKDIARMLDWLSSMDKTKAVDLTRYWGAMIAIYTGARLNEVASLTPDDIICEEETGIWYFSITDEEESKRTKTDASNRFVPVHSKLIELGLLDYVRHAREVISKKPKTNDYPTRLLYNLSHTDSGWGRKLGSWFNGKGGALVSLGLKSKKTTLHSLRHSFITYLSINVEFSHIRAIVGHEGGTVTDRQYIHFELDHLPVFKEAIERLPY